MSRKKLIFFSSAHPDQDGKPAWSAYHFALVATRAGLAAEVRLAGDAVLALTERVALTGEQGKSLRSYMRDARELGVFVSA